MSNSSETHRDSHHETLTSNVNLDNVGQLHNEKSNEIDPKPYGINNKLDNHHTNHQVKDEVSSSSLFNGREISNTILYIGNLDKLIIEEELINVFQKYGSIKMSKILNDKNNNQVNYAFIEFFESTNATNALNNLNGIKIGSLKIKINWAFRSTNANSVQSTEPVFNIFVGDLSPDINDEILFKNFKIFNPREAHVMWDMKTLRSRGYGFVTFLSEWDATLALNTMNGSRINGRIIRCNWASHKQLNTRKSSLTTDHPHQLYQLPKSNPSSASSMSGPGHLMKDSVHKIPSQPIVPHISSSSSSLSSSSTSPSGNINRLIRVPHNPSPIVSSPITSTAITTSTMSHDHPPLGYDDLVTSFETLTTTTNDANIPTYDLVYRQAPTWQTTVYLGNLSHFINQHDLIPTLNPFGYILEFKLYPEKGFAFVKYDSHEAATFAIISLSGCNINGRPLKCGWGKLTPRQPYRDIQ